MSDHLPSLWLLMAFFALLLLPVIAWGVYVAVRRRVSLRSLFVLIAIEAVLLAAMRFLLGF
jgi:hypothetical protein